MSIMVQRRLLLTYLKNVVTELNSYFASVADILNEKPSMHRKITAVGADVCFLDIGLVRARYGCGTHYCSVIY